MKVESKYTLIVLIVSLLTGGLLQATVPGDGIIREPEILRSIEPVVPPAFARYKVKGSVEVLFQIGANGRPEKIEVESATHFEYAEAVKNALRSWRFERHPEQTGVFFRLPVVFN